MRLDGLEFWGIWVDLTLHDFLSQFLQILLNIFLPPTATVITIVFLSITILPVIEVK